jgi:hypothetical protein
MSYISELVINKGIRISQYDAHYKAHTDNPINSCDKCAYYCDSQSCILVDGEVNTDGSCLLWETRPSLPVSTIRLSDATDTRAAKIPLAQVGKWKHPKFGLVEFDTSDFDQIISNYKQDVLGYKPFITFGHLDEEPNSTDSHRKRGDLMELVVEDDTLFGLFEASDSTAKFIQDGAYEYASGEFVRNYIGKDTQNNVGTVFSRVALTNSPFVPFRETKAEVIHLSLGPDQLANTLLSVSLAHEPYREELSMSMNNNEATVIESVEVSQTDNLVVEPTVVVESTVESPVVPSTTSVVVEPVVVPTTTTPIAPVSTVVGISMNEVTEQINSVKTETAALIEAFKSQLAEITSSVSTLANSVNSQQTVTQAFSDSMSKEYEASIDKYLLNAGVSPVVIKRFSELRPQLQNKTIKLSDSNEEVNVVQALSDLLVTAAQSEHQVVGPLGSSHMVATNGFEAIIARNKAKAK